MNGNGIGVVVVSWDSEETLDACLSGLRAADGVRAIRVVDCNSRDSSLAIAQRHALADPRLRFIAYPDHPGLGEARNRGVADCDAPWLALVDPTCLVATKTLAQLRDVSAQGAAIVGPALVDESGRDEPAARLRLGRSQPAAGWRRWLGLGFEPADAAAAQAVDALAGALLVLPRAAFDLLGGCDPAYVTGVASVDLCGRARTAGVGIICANAVRVIRVRGLVEQAHPLYLAWFQRVDASRHAWRHARRGHWLGAFARIWRGFPWDLLRALARTGAQAT